MRGFGQTTPHIRNRGEPEEEAEGRGKINKKGQATREKRRRGKGSQGKESERGRARRNNPARGCLPACWVRDLAGGFRRGAPYGDPGPVGGGDRRPPWISACEVSPATGFRRIVLNCEPLRLGLAFFAWVWGIRGTGAAWGFLLASGDASCPFLSETLLLCCDRLVLTPAMGRIQAISSGRPRISSCSSQAAPFWTNFASNCGN